MILIAIYFLIGITMFFLTALRPKMFWPLVIFSSVFAVGLMVKGYCIVDEFFIFCILFSALLLVSIRAVPVLRENKRFLHVLFFLLFAVYMFIESIYGVLLWKDPRIFRWVIFYFLLGIFAVLMNRRKFVFPEKKQANLIILLSGLAYLLFYLAVGLFLEARLGYFGRFSNQGIWWSGSAYAMFLLVILIPAAIFCLREKRVLIRVLGWVALGVIAFAAYFFDSRVSWLSLAAFFIGSIPALKLRRSLPVIFCFFLVVSAFFWSGNSREFTDSLKKQEIKFVKSAEVLWAPRPSDVDRNLQIKISIAAITRNWKNFLFGYGMHSSHYVLVEYKKEFYSKFLPNVPVGDVVRTTAFAAILTDTGMVGIVLFLANFFFTGRQIAINLKNDASKQKYLYYTVLFVSFLWIFVTNTQDITLIYFLIMPMGLLDNLSLEGSKKYGRQ